MDTNKPTFWEKVATFIVDKRNIFFLFFIAAGIFCAISRFSDSVSSRFVVSICTVSSMVSPRFQYSKYGRKTM